MRISLNRKHDVHALQAKSTLTAKFINLRKEKKTFIAAHCFDRPHVCFDRLRIGLILAF